MKKISAVTGSYTEVPFWNQQFDLRQINLFRGGRSIVDLDAAINCRLYITTRKTLKFGVVIHSIPIDNFKDHYVVVLDFTWMQFASEKRHYA